MSGNLYDIAYDLEKEIRQSAEYQQLQQAYAEITQEETSRNLFTKFRDFQLKFHERQMAGEQINQEEMMMAGQLLLQAQQYPKIVKIMELEQRLSFLIAEVNKIAMKPLEELYSSL